MNKKLSLSKFTRFFLIVMIMIPALASSPLSMESNAQERSRVISLVDDPFSADLAAKIGEESPLKIIIDPDLVGFFVPSKYRWYMKTNTVDGWSGVVDFGWGGVPELMPVVGDWDGDGEDTAGFYKPSQWKWFLKNDQSDGWSGVTSFQWGGNAEMIPIAGDWDGDGDDTVGFFKPSTSEWFLKTNNNGGWTGFTTVVFGGAPGNIPIVGDWDGDGDDTIGFFVPSSNKWWLKNNLTDGWGGVTGFNFGTAAAMEPVVGDWDGDGDDTVGGYVASKYRWFLKDDQVSGWSNVSLIKFGTTAGATPIAGKWGSSSGGTCYTLSRYYTGTGSAPTASPSNSTGCSSGQYTAGQAITLTPHPATGWGLDYWTGTNCTSCSFFTMPASSHSVTAHYEQTTPTTLRISNDLYGGSGMNLYNSLLWIRTAAHCSDFTFSGTHPSSGTEYLYPFETTSDAGNTLALQTGYYLDFDVSGIPLASDGSYCVLIEAGWWDTIFNISPPYNFLYYEKTPTNCLCCDGVSTCQKWAEIQVTKPYGDPEVINVGDFLPDYGWNGTAFCP